MFSKLLTLLISGFLFLSFAPPAFAAITYTLSNPQYSGDDVTVDISLAGLSCPNAYCYLQLAFTEAGANPQYFGFTKNHLGSFYGYVSTPDPAYIQSTFFAFQPVSGSWSGQITAKADINDTDYKGPGSYQLKGWRYTGNSNSSSGTSDNILTVNITGPSFSPTPTPSPTPTSTATSTNTPTPTSSSSSSSTNTPTPTHSTSSGSSTKKPTNTPTPTKKENSSLETTKVGTEEAVLGLNSSDPTPTPEETAIEGEKKGLGLGKSLIAGGLALIGATFLGLAGYSLLKKTPQSLDDESARIEFHEDA